MPNSCIWIFVFPAKEDSTDWEGIAKKLVVQKYLGTIHLRRQYVLGGRKSSCANVQKVTVHKDQKSPS